MFPIHSWNCSTVFCLLLDSVFLQGWNSITSLVLLTARFKPSLLSRDVQAGRVGATGVHMFKFKPNPRRMHKLLHKSPFSKKYPLFSRSLKSRELLFLHCFSGTFCMWVQILVQLQVVDMYLWIVPLCMLGSNS